MTYSSDLVNNQIPIGDKLRTTYESSLATSDTIVSVASGGGFIQGIHFRWFSNTNRYLDGITVTIDGAAARPLAFYIAATASDGNYYLPLMIPFNTSCSITATTVAGTGILASYCIYSVK